MRDDDDDEASRYNAIKDLSCSLSSRIRCGRTGLVLGKKQRFKSEVGIGLKLKNKGNSHEHHNAYSTHALKPLVEHGGNRHCGAVKPW